MTDQEKYIFVSYAHKDSAAVVPLIENMRKAGFRVWYDDGIETGAEWPAYIQASLEKSAVALVFISKNSVESVNCRNEINFALMKSKDMIVVHLEDTELKYGMGLQLNGIQSILMYEYEKASDFFTELTETPLLQICREGHELLDSGLIDGSDFGKGFTCPSKVLSDETASAKSILKRLKFLLEEKQWKEADECCERLLDIDMENADAYLGKLMAELHISQKEDLKTVGRPFDTSVNYQRAVQFGAPQIQQELNDAAALANAEYEKRRAKQKKETALLLTSILCFLIGVLVVSYLLIAVILPAAEQRRIEAKYNDAIALMREEKCEEAILAFEALGGYKDSADKINECYDIMSYDEAIALLDDRKYDDAIAMFEAIETYRIHEGKSKEFYNTMQYNVAMDFMEAGKYDEAISELDPLGDFRDSLEKLNECYMKTVEASDCIKFGLYEQDNDISNGKEEIEWLVLDVVNGKALVVSKYALNAKQYNTRKIDSTWETCTLRTWLNQDFLNSAFSDKEKAKIPTVTVSADSYSINSYQSNTPQGNATQDRIFLLSIQEVNRYLNNSNIRGCHPTAYAQANGADINDSNGNCVWWVRSMGSASYRAANIYSGGEVNYSGDTVTSDIAVRPAMWIDLNS